MESSNDEDKQTLNQDNSPQALERSLKKGDADMHLEDQAIMERSELTMYRIEMEAKQDERSMDMFEGQECSPQPFERSMGISECQEASPQSMERSISMYGYQDPQLMSVGKHEGQESSPQPLERSHVKGEEEEDLNKEEFQKQGNILNPPSQSIADAIGALLLSEDFTDAESSTLESCASSKDLNERFKGSIALASKTSQVQARSMLFKRRSLKEEDSQDEAFSSESSVSSYDSQDDDLSDASSVSSDYQIAPSIDDPQEAFAESISNVPTGEKRSPRLPHLLIVKGEMQTCYYYEVSIVYGGLIHHVHNLCIFFIVPPSPH
jgi:hypothetical protein